MLRKDVLAVLTFFVLLVPCACEPKAEPAASLRVLAERRGMQIGTAVEAEPIQREAVYGETLAREFNMLTPSYAMKFKPIHPARDSYYFRNADAIVDFAEANGIKVHGHTLVWYLSIDLLIGSSILK